MSGSPTLRVVNGGEPAPEQLAALVAAVRLRRDEQPQPSRRGSRWADRRDMLRAPLQRRRTGRWRGH